MIKWFDRDDLLKFDIDEREKILRSHLSNEKCKVLDKYGLTSNGRLYWEKIQEKYPIQEFFSHKFAVKASVLGMIFHINRLCFAKVKYFENNWDDYEPCKYVWRKRDFVSCELYDLEAIRQKETGIVIDLKDLGRIKWFADFVTMCEDLEGFKRKAIEEKNINLFTKSINIINSEREAI